MTGWRGAILGPRFAFRNGMARPPTLRSCFSLGAASLAATGCGTPSFAATATPLGIVPQSSTIQGRDGGQSGLAFGHSVWTYDTAPRTSSSRPGPCRLQPRAGEPFYIAHVFHQWFMPDPIG